MSQHKSAYCTSRPECVPDSVTVNNPELSYPFFIGLKSSQDLSTKHLQSFQNVIQCVQTPVHLSLNLYDQNLSKYNQRYKNTEEIGLQIGLEKYVKTRRER